MAKESVFQKIAGKFRPDPEKKAKKKKAIEEEREEFEREEEIRKERAESYAALEARVGRDKGRERVAPNDDIMVLSHVSKVYSNRVEAVHDFNLDVQEGEFIVLVGPSGCGKSTTLRMIAGLEDITEGDFFVNGVYANKLEPRERGVSMVFQSYALYPHMSVRENMAFGLNGLSREEKERRIQDAAKILSLEPYLDRRPSALSGGQNQRVALGRAIVRQSKIFLLDEPLSNLDAKLRVQMRIELVKLHERLKNTMVYVTHDQVEAMTMATRIVVMDKGRIQQVGTPEEIYAHPKNVFVATFIGSPAMGVLSASLSEAGEATLPGGAKIALPSFVLSSLKESLGKIEAALAKDVLDASEKLSDLKENQGKGASYLLSDAQKALDKAEERLAQFKGGHGDIILGLRPEEVRLTGTSKDLSFKATLDVKELLGSEFALHFLLGEEKLLVYVPADEGFKLQEGEELALYVNPKDVHIFDESTELSLI